MHDLFHSHDGAYHEGGLYYKDNEVVSMVIETLIAKPGRPAQWEWMVWATGGLWNEPVVGWHGADASLEQAKLSALDAAVELAVDLSDGLDSSFQGPVIPTGVDIDASPLGIRHGPACPGQLFPHLAATGGPDKTGHDDVRRESNSTPVGIIRAGI